MNRKTEFIIFFSVLITIGVLVFSGVAYFRAEQKPDGLLSDTTPTTLQAQSQNPEQAPETIPSSSIIASQPTASSTPVKELALPYSLNASTANETYWPKAWGSVSFANNNLALIPDSSTHGANSFLNGASSWANYAVNANVSWLRGGWFDIVARVSNNTQNFVYCEFGSNGTEIIERVNGADTQSAFTAVSSTDVQDATENFGMKVYGNDIACVIANQEVVGVHVATNESRAGGIGFVIFGQPSQQKQVMISNISVTKLAADTIVAPFSVAVAPPANFVPPPQAAAPQPPAQTKPSAPVTPPAPTATTTKSLPYSASTFNSVDWIDAWGGSGVANSILTVGSNASINSGGIFLDGSNAWTNYIFTADLNLVKGGAFALIARRTDYSDFAECIFSNVNTSLEYVSIDRVVNGQTVLMGDGQVFVNNAGHIAENNIKASMQMNGSKVQCSIDGATVLDNVNNGLPANLLNGGIGFIAWDDATNNSQIVVNQISVTPL